MPIETSTPGAEGVDPAGVEAFVDALDRDPRIEPHGLILQRHGKRIAEAYWAPHTADCQRIIYSLSKTFTGSALGLAVGEGLLSLDDLASDHLPDLWAGAHDRTRRIKVRHLASMASGHDREMLLDAMVADEDDVVRGFFQLAPPEEPGTRFAYNQPTVLALATILERVTGQRLSQYLRPRLLDPLGIETFAWHQHRPGLDLGYSGVYTNLDAVARLGQLYLDHGVWEGRQVLPEGWVADAARAHVANPGEPEVDWQQGYGFQLWMNRHGYRGDGAFGQFMIVLPEQDATLAVFSGNEDMQAILDHAWTILLPAFGETPVDRDLHLPPLTLPTAADRTGGTVPDPSPQSFTRDPDQRSHRTIKRVEIAGDELLVHERTETVRLPLRTGWTRADGHPIATSASQLGDAVHVEVVPLSTPFRLELHLDRTAGTFVAWWPKVPLFGGGLDPHLSKMVPPN